MWMRQLLLSSLYNNGLQTRNIIITSFLSFDFKVKSPMDQFINGVKDMNLLEYIQNDHKTWEPFFVDRSPYHQVFTCTCSVIKDFT